MNTLNKFTRYAFVFGMAFVFASNAWAMSASEAKSAGLIKEDCRGYVVALKPEGQAVANDINAKRMAEYKKIAAADGKITVDMVAAATGSKLCGK